MSEGHTREVESSGGVDEPRPAEAEAEGTVEMQEREEDLRARATALDARAAEQRKTDELQVRRERSQDRRDQWQQQDVTSSEEDGTRFSVWLPR